MPSAFPFTIDEGDPDGATVSARAIDTEIQDVKKQFDAVLGFAGAGATFGLQQSGGSPIHWLTNKTGGNLSNGNVVGVDTANNSAVALSDTQHSKVPLVVYIGSATLADGSAGPFVSRGVVTCTSTGTIARGQYVRKSATTLAVEDADVAVAATAQAPENAIGVALAAASGGTVVALLFGHPMHSTGWEYMGSTSTEATVTDTSAVDIVTLTVRSIATTRPLLIIAALRKTSGGAHTAAVGLKLNTSVVRSALQWDDGSANNRAGVLVVFIPAQEANYLRAGFFAISGEGVSGSVNNFDADMPNAAITSVVIRGNVSNALTSMSVDNVSVYAGRPTA